MESFKRILILCVDRDDDIGVKTGIKTPIIGRDVNVRAASELAVEDPEEADANSMFAAVKLYDTLSERGGEELYEVAVSLQNTISSILPSLPPEGGEREEFTKRFTDLKEAYDYLSGLHSEIRDLMERRKSLEAEAEGLKGAIDRLLSLREAGLPEVARGRYSFLKISTTWERRGRV